MEKNAEKHDRRGIVMLDKVRARVNGRLRTFAKGGRYSTAFAPVLPPGSFEYYKPKIEPEYDTLVVEVE